MEEDEYRYTLATTLFCKGGGLSSHHNNGTEDTQFLFDPLAVDEVMKLRDPEFPVEKHSSPSTGPDSCTTGGLHSSPLRPPTRRAGHGLQCWAGCGWRSRSPLNLSNGMPLELITPSACQSSVIGHTQCDCFYISG